jgi:hypothetical protein
MLCQSKCSYHDRENTPKNIDEKLNDLTKTYYQIAIGKRYKQ